MYLVNNPDYNIIKVTLLLIILLISGIFIYNKLNQGQTGQVIANNSPITSPQTPSPKANTTVNKIASLNITPIKIANSICTSPTITLTNPKGGETFTRGGTIPEIDY